MTILTARRRALKVRPVLDVLDDRVLLDAQPSGLPLTYEPPPMTAEQYRQHELAMQNYAVIQSSPDIKPGVPDLGPAIVQSYGQYASTLLGVVPDQGPSYNPPLGSPANPVPMGQHVIDAAISQILVGEHSKDLDPTPQQAVQPVGSAPAPSPNPEPVGLNPAGPPYPYEPIAAL